jgi:hypothetical protein
MGASAVLIQIQFRQIRDIAKGVHQDHGLAVYSTQQKRLCLLLGTIYGHTDEEALWCTFMWWAKL